jgi:hypothetical protein
MALMTDDRTTTRTALLPVTVRRVVVVVIGALLGLSAYLMAVRGEVMLFDLPSAAARLFCL